MNCTQRIEWIDIAKGLSIILVVFGHSILSSIPFLGDWCASYRIPFFFFISGLLFNPNKRFSNLITNKTKALGIPFVIFSLIVILGYIIIDKKPMLDMARHVMIYGWEGYALWFIPVLFVTNILYFLIFKYTTSPINRLLVLICLAGIGYYLSITQSYNFWNLNFALTAVLFYGMGNILSSTLIDILNQSPRVVAVLTSIMALISCLFIFNEKPEFFINRLRGGGITHIVGIAGAIMMCGVAVKLSALNSTVFKAIKNSIKYWGKNSYVVLAFHQILLMLFAFLIPQIPVLGRHVLMWVCLIIIIELLNRKLPWILGRF